MTTLSPAKYSAIRRQLNFSVVHHKTLLVIATNACLIALSLFLLAQKNHLCFAISQFLLSIAFFRSFCLLHECGHESATRFRWLNSLIGHIASLFCFIPYFGWKHSHNQHHAWSGHLEHDPSLGLLRRVMSTDASSFRGRIQRGFILFAWITWLPVLGAAQHILFWCFPLTLLKDFKKNRKRILQSMASTLFLALGYAALLQLFPTIVNFSSFGVAIVLYLTWVELINFPHHLNTEVIDKESPVAKFSIREQSRSTRSCYYPRFIAEFFLLNFNFHIEHHLFPKLPWHQLRNARDLVKAELEDSYNEEQGIAWNLSHRKMSSIDECFLSHTPVRDSSE